MRRFAWSLWLVLSLLAGARADTVMANGVVAVVNDAVITWKDVEQYVAAAMDVLQRTYYNQPAVLERRLQQARQEGVEQLVERKLILHEFKSAGYNLPDSIIEDRVKARIREHYGDRLTLTKSLQAEGLTYETFKTHIREDFIVSAMRSKNISQEILVSPHKIEKFYADNLDKLKVADQVKLRMIVLTQPPNGPPGTAKKLAQEILAKLDEGVPFAEMASVYSEGSQRAQGGEWGWVERSVLRKELAEAAFSLKPGQRSGVIEIKEASYLMLVEAAQAKHTQTLAEVRDEIERTLVAEERARLNKKWIDKLKAKSFVRYF
jgi:parvulin-like peptidyl-prolyl isomerase